MGIKGRLYIRRLEIVDDSDKVIYRVKDVSVKKGFQDALEVIRYKDSEKSLRNILKNVAKYVDDDFKKLFGLED